MIDYRLKFTTEAAAQAVLFDAESGNQKYTYIDQIGVIYKPTGKVIKTNMGDVPETAPINGWHVNVRTAEDAPELDQFVVIVNNPVRVWA